MVPFVLESLFFKLKIYFHENQETGGTWEGGENQETGVVFWDDGENQEPNTWQGGDNQETNAWDDNQ